MLAMAEPRVLPSGKVYRQIFDAQVQLSRCLQASRRGREPAGGLLSGCLPAEGSADSGQQTNTQPGARDADTANREQLSALQRKQGREEQQDEADVRRLPDDIVSDRPSSDIVARLREKKHRDHIQAVEQLHADLAVISMDYERGYRQACGELLSSLSAEEQRSEEQLDRLETLTLQELYAQWEAVREECALRRKRIRALDQTLTGYEADRANMISILLRKYSGQLERISYLLPSDIHGLMDTEAMMINQALLANRGSVAHLILHLLEESLQKESLLWICWEERLAEWRSRKINHIISTFRDVTCSDVVQRSSQVQQTVQEMRSAQQSLVQPRRHIIQQLCTLVPPSCSRSLVSDWFSQLTAVNKKMDSVHLESMRQLRGCYEQRWQDCLAEVERCKEEVSALGLSKEEVNDIINSQLLNLIGRCQSQAEEQLATLDRGFESLAQYAGELSRSACAALHGAVLLWETHTTALERRKRQLQQHLDLLTHAQEQEVQKNEAYLDVLLDKLRQESTEEALKSSLEKTLSHLEEQRNSFSQRFGEECEAVECFPGLVLEELNTYSSALSKYYHLNHTHTLSPDTLRSLYPSISLDLSGRAGIQKPRQIAKKLPISLQRNRPHSGVAFSDWLFTETESSLVHLWDSGTTVTFISSGGGAYNGPAFICPAPEPLDVLEEEIQLALFPTDLLTESLTRMRALYFDHLEQRFHDVLSSTVAMVTGRKVALRSEHDLRLQLHERRAQRIETDIHNTRAAELVLHRERVERHCKGVVQTLTSCRADFLLLQETVGRTTEDFRTKIYKIMDQFIYATKSDILVSLSSTLQDSLDQHIEEIQSVQRSFRQSVQNRMDDLRNSNARLLQSFRLFSEGGNFTPKEVDFLHRRLEKVVKHIDATEESIQTNMEDAESKSLEQAKEIVSRFEEKFHFLTVDLEFLEMIQSVLTNTQVQLKAQAAKSNQQKLHISSRLEELKKMADNTQVTPDQVCSFLASLSDDLRTRCRYLDCFLDSSLAAPVPHCPFQGPFALAARPKVRRQECLAPSTSLLQPCKMGVTFSDDAAVGLVKGLNRLSSSVCIPPAPADREDSRAVSPGQKKSQDRSSPQRRKSTESVSRQSGRRFSKPSRTDRRFQVFGPKPEQDSQSFKSVVNSFLWKANDAVLLEAEKFYKQESRAVMRPQCLANSFEQCAEGLNKRLLGYQDQANQFYNTSLQEFREQLCVLEEVVCSLPAVLFRNHGQQHVSGLLENTGRIRQELEESLSASEDRKVLVKLKEHTSQMSVRLGHPACDEELEALKSREEERQVQLHSAITRTYQKLQDCLCVGRAAFVTSLASLTETLLFQMDDLLTVDQVTSGETKMSVIQRQHQPQSGDLIQRGSRTWPGVPYILPPPESPERDTPSVTTMTSASSVTTATSPNMATTASITTAKTSLGHMAVIEQRDAALKVYEQVYRTQLCEVQTDTQRLLLHTHRWRQDWTQQIHTLTHLHAE